MRLLTADFWDSGISCCRRSSGSMSGTSDKGPLSPPFPDQMPDFPVVISGKNCSTSPVEIDFKGLQETPKWELQNIPQIQVCSYG